MKKALKIITLASFGLFSLHADSAVAGEKLKRPTPNGADYNLKSGNGGVSQPGEISDMVHKAAWFRNRDNSMSPAKTGVGAAMAIVMTNRGTTQGVQVCPGVYLATAHGLIDPPNGPNGQYISWDMFSYPISKEGRRPLPDLSTFVSPRLNNPSAWDVADTDYAFFKIDDPPNTEYITPVRATDDQIASDSLKVHLYRSRVQYVENADGSPDFDSDFVSGRELGERHQHPYRVDVACDIINPSYSKIMETTCPTEDGVSGSSYVYEGAEKNYLIGLHSRGYEVYYKSYEGRDGVANAFVQSAHFCDDYQSLCGKPCAELNEVSGGSL